MLKWENRILHYLPTSNMSKIFVLCFMNVAGLTDRLPDKKITKCFVSGLKPDVFREEMCLRTFETLEDVIRE